MSDPPPRDPRPPMLDPDYDEHARPSFPYVEPGEMEDVPQEQGRGLFMAYTVRR